MRTLKEFERRHSTGIKGFISSVEVKLEGNEVLVLLNVVREPRRLNELDPQERLKFIQKFLSEKIDQPVHLKVRVVPVDIWDYEIDAPSTENN